MMDDSPPFRTVKYQPPAGQHEPHEGQRRPSKDKAKRFKPERWRDITFESNGEWRIKKILPRRGVGVIFGLMESFKSFVAIYTGLCVALGLPWAGRRTNKAAVVYIAGEGAGGLRKRKAGYVKAWKDLSADVDFALISAAPNLGTGSGDRSTLITAIDDAGLKPGLIIIDTAASALAGADENGAGMSMLISNAFALAEHYECLVLLVHHVGHSDPKRERGHSSLPAAADVRILCERYEGELRTKLTVAKLKDEAHNVTFEVKLRRVVVAYDEDDEEVSTLIVDSVTEIAEPIAGADEKPSAKRSPDQKKIVRDAFVDAYDRLAYASEKTPGSDGKPVLKVRVDAIRDELKARGFLETNEKGGGLSNTGRSDLLKAKRQLLATKKYVEKDGFFWRIS